MILMYLTPDWEEQMTYPVVKLHLLLLLYDPDDLNQFIFKNLMQTFIIVQ